MNMTTQGLVLNRKKVAESDVIITVLTKSMGKYRVYVNGARHPKSKFVAVTQPFVEAEFSLVIKKDLSSLIGAQTTKAHLAVREAVDKMFFGTYLLELVDASTEENNPTPKIYDMLSSALTALENADNAWVLKAVFGLKLLQRLGVEPLLTACSNCGSQSDLLPIISVDSGGLVCKVCINDTHHHHHLSAQHLKWINVALKSPYATVQSLEVSGKIVSEVNTLLDDYIDAHLVRKPLKSLEVLKTVSL